MIWQTQQHRALYWRPCSCPKFTPHLITTCQQLVTRVCVRNMVMRTFFPCNTVSYHQVEQ